MKIDFALTLDQFVEAYNYHRQSRDSRRLFIPCVVMLLIMAGYCLTPFREDPNASRAMIVAYGRTIPLAGALILEMGLLLPFIAIRIWVADSRGNPENTRKKLQSRFERFYTGPRTFEANESTWQFGFKESVDTRKWADLALMTKATDFFILQSATDSYTLPRAAMTAEQCKLLEDLCKSALLPKKPAFSVSLVPTAWDYVTARMRGDWWEHPWRMSAFALGGLAYVWFFSYAAAQAWHAVGYLISVPLVLSLPLLHAVRTYDRYEYYRQHCFQRAEIGEDRICFVTGTLQDIREMRIVRYQWLWRVRESRRMILLYLYPKSAFLIPKAAFESQDLSQFRRLVGSHLSTG